MSAPRIREERLQTISAFRPLDFDITHDELVSMATELIALRPLVDEQIEAEQARIRISHALYGEGIDPGHPLHAVTDALIAVAGVGK